MIGFHGNAKGRADGDDEPPPPLRGKPRQILRLWQGFPFVASAYDNVRLDDRLAIGVPIPLDSSHRILSRFQVGSTDEGGASHRPRWACQNTRRAGRIASPLTESVSPRRLATVNAQLSQKCNCAVSTIY